MDDSQTGNSEASVIRIQENLLARSERKILTYLCAHMPAWVTPNMLSGIGMFGAGLIFVGYLASNLDTAWLWLSILGFAIQWFGDSTDGSLARFRKIERPRFGFFLDHSLDVIAISCIAIGMGVSPFMSIDVALFALIGYMMLTIHTFLSLKVVGQLKLSYMNAGPTELRILLIALTVAMMVLGPDFKIASFGGFDVIAGILAIVLSMVFLIQTSSMVRLLSLQDPPRNHEWLDKTP